jgi:GT2 family glycosyltransferase
VILDGTDGEDCGKLLAVIVLYNRTLQQVPCGAQVLCWLDTGRLAHCLVYDNSPIDHARMGIPVQDKVNYVHDPANGGTRCAYHRALDEAERTGCRWILFLDHDTHLPVDFLDATAAARGSAGVDAPRCAAIVPEIRDGSVAISPSRITGYGRVMPWSRAAPSAAGELTAISSATVARVSALKRLVPFPVEFSLDYLDHWIFREIQRHGGVVLVSRAVVAHSLSVQDMSSIGASRYRSILAAEHGFLASGAGYSRWKHLLWQLARTAKMLVLVRRLDLFGVCISMLLKVGRVR